MPKTLPGMAAAIPLVLAGLRAAATPEFSQTPLFVGGVGGYYGYRIPAISVTASGAVVAFCEGRKNSLSDRGDIDILIRRSTDEGATWSPPQIVVEEGGTAPIAFGNPMSVLDTSTGTLHLLCCRNNDRVFHLFSTDDGLSWSAPVEITATVKLEPWGWYATGPGHGIQLKRGIHAGRLVIPCDHRTGPDGVDTGSHGAHVIFSDDHGATWQLGASAETANGVHPSETLGVELVGASPLQESKIYFNARNESGGLRGEGYSLDSGASFTAATFTGNPVFVSPVVQGSVQRFHATDENGPYNRILFSCPNSYNRSRISIWSSFDETASWSAPKLIYPGPSAYSDLARTSGGDVAMIYESGVTSPNERITFARFNEEWLNVITQGGTLGAAFWNFEERPIGQVTSVLEDAIRDVHPDHLGMHMTAQLAFPVVAGSPAFGNGSAINFNGNDGIRITDVKSANRFDFGANDSFTLEVACRMPAGSTQVGALIAKDLNSFSPSWWLRVEGGKARFLISTTTTELVVTSTTSINDGEWHHIAAVRDANNPAAKQLRIYVDGLLCGTLADTTTLSLANGQDVWIGRYNSGNRLFTGDIDFARITPQALAPAAFVSNWTQFDADADGIPDAFELSHVNDLALLGKGDLDSDGIADLSEFAFGTHPLVRDIPSVAIETGPDFIQNRIISRTLPPWLDLRLSSSDDLHLWRDAPSTKSVLTRPDGRLDRMDRIEQPQGVSGRQFFRYQLLNSR
jgi:sialidase-1